MVLVPCSAPNEVDAVADLDWVKGCGCAFVSSLGNGLSPLAEHLTNPVLLIQLLCRDVD